MAQKVTLRVSAAIAAYVGPDAVKEERLRAARGEMSMGAADLGTLLFLLSRDQDPDIRSAAVRSLRGLPDSALIPLAVAPETHPLLLDTLARIHYANAHLVELILAHPALDSRTRQFLAERGEGAPSPAAADPPLDGAEADERPAGEDHPPADDAEASPAGEGEDEQADEEYFSKYKLLQNMPINEKIRMAMVGDKEWRSLLIKESNKLVSTAVIKNPRITEPEVLAIAKSAELNEEVIRLVCMNKEWIKVYPIRKALVENCKTPLPRALRFLSTLNEKDLAGLAKSKNISSVIARQAQRLLFSKKTS